MAPEQVEISAANENSSSPDTDEQDEPGSLVSSLNSTPPPPNPSDIDRWNYHTNLTKFGNDLQAAANAVFPNVKRSRYSRVFVLILSWELEDPQLPVSLEINELQHVFQDIYHFETELYKIPDQDCHYKLFKKIGDFVEPVDDSNNHLKIVYYAGHARLSENQTLVWTRYVHFFNRNIYSDVTLWKAFSLNSVR
jgi:hypothetical protein